MAAERLLMLEHRLIHDEEERRELETLLARCDLADGTEQPVFVPPPGEYPDGGIPLFLWLKEGQLTGMLIVEGWPIPEGVPLVHPDHRRGGIGSALVRAATEACRMRGGKRWLMTSDSRTSAAEPFAASVGAREESSEYRMDLDLSLLPPVAADSDGVELQEVGAEDLELYAGVVAESFDDPPDQVLRWCAEQLGRPGVRMFLALRHGEPVGTVRLITASLNAYITAVGVLPRYRRMGIGRRLVLTTARDLVVDGWTSIRIEVDTANDAAYRLYRACGFRKSRVYRFFELRT